MRPEAIFMAAYSVVLVATALGLHRLGRLNTDAWRSRALAGYRREAGEPPKDTRGDWPHSELPRLHTGLAVVAACAGSVLLVAELVRHHRLVEVVVLGTALVVELAVLSRLVVLLRPSGPRD